MSKRTLSTKRFRALAAAAGCLAAAALAPKAAAQALTGAGSTFINPIMQNWIAQYRQATGISVNYQSIGSGGGISGLINHTVDFAGSDAPMNAQELARAGSPVLHIPVVIGTECVAYNVPGLRSGIHLTGPVIADIFLGKIERWNDPAITSLNPGVGFPNERIFVSHRSDGSGTTYIFTDYLSKISPEWKQTVGAGKSVHWPVGLGGKGNEGVSALLETHPYSIGYIELAYAAQNRIAYAVVRNAKGHYVAPSANSGSIAAEGVVMPPDMRVSITNTNAAAGYPITGFSWLIVYEQTQQAAQIKRFLSWVTTTGQGDAERLEYAPVPERLRKRLAGMIASIH